ncbi:YbfB/YjiJ family MFS transporter (plasmid) [Niallia circulans]|uniref:YbfB/YjiJ family MFS transporter n=1 Tax=Niallia circulans TaxID=1397 RepID=A0A553SQG8_NIACI|nr:YbfB/YjiJ family MFS transporter [Niallia circulans]TRZ39228.1 YbfB/YjiJ family MFS transporter [Niallia circulans]
MNKQLILFLFGGIFSLIIAMGFGRFAYTPILPLMQHYLSFSDSIAGYLATSNYAGYLFGAILTGAISFKERRILILRIGLLLNILTTALMGLVSSNLLWIVLRFLSGFSSALVLVLASGLVLDRLASRNKSNWSGVFYGGVGLGIYLSSLIIPSLNDMFLWKGTWMGLAVVSLILFIFVWMWLEETPQEIKIKKQEINPNFPPTKWLFWLMIAYGLEGLGYIVTGTFIVSIAQETPSFENNATIVWMIVGLAAIPSCFLWTLLAQKSGFVKSLILAMVLQSIGVVLPVLYISEVSFVTSALLFGATFMGITSLVTTLAQKINPSISAKTIGSLTAIYAGGQLIGPSLAGIISSHTHSFDAALIGASCVIFIGALFLLTGIKFESKREVSESNFFSK